MRRVIVITALVSSLILVNCASAQVQFTPDRKNSIAVDIGFGGGEDLSSAQTGLTYTAGGKYDFSLFYNRTDFKSPPAAAPLKSSSFIPQFSVALVKPDRRSNVGATLQASYEFASFESRLLDEISAEMTGEISMIGAIGYAVIDTDIDLKIYPEIRADYVSARVNLDPAEGPDQEDSVSDISLGAGLTALFSERIRASATFRSFDGQKAWAFTVGYIRLL